MAKLPARVPRKPAVIDIPQEARNDEALREAMYVAGVQRLYWRHGLDQYGAKGQTLRTVVENYNGLETYPCGVSVHGAWKERPLVFGVLAKELVLSGTLITLRRVTDISGFVERGSEGVIEKFHTLAIASFYDRSVDCPFTPGERYRLESFLVRWLEFGHKLVLSSSHPILECKWYADEFRNMLDLHIPEIDLGR